MSEVSTTKLSSRGQVVIPEEIRHRLNLRPGARFVVLGEGDTVVLKLLTEPRREEFDDLLAKARAQAKRAGLKPSDVKKVIEQIRRDR